jgi:hypothetical protein
VNRPVYPARFKPETKNSSIDADEMAKHGDPFD